MALRAALHPLPGCLSLPRTIRRWQPDGFEPQQDIPSPLHLAGKLLKKLLRFRKTLAPFSGMILCRHIRDAPEVVVEKQSVPDPNEDACSETPKSSLSSSSSVDSLVMPPYKGVMAGSAQMMASMLLLVLDNEGDDSDASEQSEDDETFSGPRLSTWHQPAEPDEFVNSKQEWRWLQHGDKSSTLVSQTVKNTEAPDYVRYKYLATVSGTTVHRNTVTLLDCLWVRGEMPHLLGSVLEVFQFNAATAVERLIHLHGPLTASSH